MTVQLDVYNGRNGGHYGRRHSRLLCLEQYVPLEVCIESDFGCWMEKYE